MMQTNWKVHIIWDPTTFSWNGIQEANLPEKRELEIWFTCIIPHPKLLHRLAKIERHTIQIYPPAAYFVICFLRLEFEIQSKSIDCMNHTICIVFSSTSTLAIMPLNEITLRFVHTHIALNFKSFQLVLVMPRNSPRKLSQLDYRP